jgi:hypothetical protein
MIIYAVFSTGVNVIIHTCGDESEALLATTSFEDPCGCTDDMAADRCCTTSLTTVKVNDAQLSGAVNSCDALWPNGMIPQQSLFQTIAPSVGADIRAFTPFSPPPQYDLNIRHSVFLI